MNKQTLDDILARFDPGQHQHSLMLDDYPIGLEMTKEEYEVALDEVGYLWGALPGTSDGDVLDVLIGLVVKYEDIHESGRWCPGGM